ncbi:ATP synthase regulation protein NCA2-domain-containing protein [Lipomyces arxii]|uniref:ATP synthase regulation protein NCA2-domain-containing protein n=1 Tax=Lipomyces arxii TaxID=56418 RepID=UPI0034CF74AE
MSSIVESRIFTLSSQLERLASESLPTLLGPRVIDSRSGSFENLRQSPSPTEEDSEKFVKAQTVVTLLNKLIVRPGSKLPSIRELNSVLQEYLAYAPDAQLALNTDKESAGQDDIWAEYKTEDDAKQAEWFIVAAATVVLYGHVLEKLLNQTLPLSEDIFYWDSVLSGRTGLFLYSVQTAPLRLLSLGSDIFADARRRMTDTLQQPSLKQWIQTIRASFNHQRRVIRRMSFLDPVRSTSMIRKVMSPMSIYYKEVQGRQQQLTHLRELQSAALGLLVGEEISLNTDTDWRRSVENMVEVMNSIICGVVSNPEQVDHFEQSVCAVSSTVRFYRPPFLVAQNIIEIIEKSLPRQSEYHSSVTKEAGKPSWIVRYWPAVFSTVVFGGTALQLLFSRRANISQWLKDLTTTAADFWKNWIVEPAQNIISTIRHDDTSQVAIVGRKSLEADMESLERMVVDFTIDTTKGLDDSEITAIKAGVREGDVSTVLRVYEKELKSPLASAVRGELVRTLLIQMQKTKVDVELAITGIDRLLKSQELVFGVVAALPSSIACWVTAKWIRGVYSGKGMRGRAELRASVVRTLGNVERILTIRTGSGDWLPYTSQGTILCEVHLLRHNADVIPRGLRNDWARDLGDLENIKLGVGRQKQTIERIWRIYGQFFQ